MQFRHFQPPHPHWVRSSHLVIHRINDDRALLGMPMSVWQSSNVDKLLALQGAGPIRGWAALRKCKAELGFRTPARVFTLCTILHFFALPERILSPLMVLSIRYKLARRPGSVGVNEMNEETHRGCGRVVHGIVTNFRADKTGETRPIIARQRKKV